MKNYDPKDIESKWQKKWQKDGLYETPDTKKGAINEYILSELPYPSGNLHVGHWYAFAVPDIYARARRMKGANVLYPIGFDAFGLPAENAAIKHKLDPKEWTYGNIEKMRGQLATMGASFDTSREIIASDPSYYKWTQWLFLKMYERGLAYRKKSTVNWDPIDKTVLANEQVMPDGTAERSGAKVEKRDLEQWFLKITDYAEPLLSGLDALNWPEEIKNAQRNWIGKSEGAEIDFGIRFEKNPKDNDRRGPDGKKAHFKIFTTRPDTLFGVTCLVISPEHLWVTLATDENHDVLLNTEEVKAYIAQAKKKSDIERTDAKKEKTGVELKGVKAINPANGEEVPVFVADYVLADYGTGAVMAVPKHDERDAAFAEKFNLPVVDRPFATKQDIQKTGAVWVKKYKIRDWSIGRQRYWGCPVPIVYDPEGKPHPIPEKHLPWLLPTDVDHTPTGEPPLSRSEELVKRTEKIFGKGWRSEVETMDTFVDSSWYYVRYLDPDNAKKMADEKKIRAWMPVSYYFGGAEHTTLHLLYSRFFYKVMHDIGVVPTDEPYTRRLNRGLILGPDGNKMSKSKGNVIDPDDLVKRFGADSVRLYLAFIGPYNEAGSYPWDPNGIMGIRRFIERVWKIQETIGSVTPDAAFQSKAHQTVKKVSEDIEVLKLNTAISSMMVLVNDMSKQPRVSRESYEMLLKLLAPFAPHVTDEIWHELGNKKSIHISEWPAYDESLIKTDRVKMAVQVNGKVRGVIEIAPDADESAAVALARGTGDISKWLGDANPKKIIYVKGRILNFIIS